MNSIASQDNGFMTDGFFITVAIFLRGDNLAASIPQSGKNIYAWLQAARQRQSLFHLSELISQVPFVQKSPLPP